MRWFRVKSATVSDAHAAAQDAGMLVDVRTARERTLDGAPAGAAHVPVDRLVEQLELFDGRQVYLICRSGKRSGRAAARLRNAGVDATNVKGGMLAWKREGLPLDSPPRRPRSR